MNRSIIRCLLIASACFFGGAALAHTSLLSSLPQDGASMDEAPTQLKLVFADPVYLAKIEVRGSAGQKIELDISNQPRDVAEFVVPLPELEAGYYTIRYSMLGEDGHAMTSAISFTVE